MDRRILVVDDSELIGQQLSQLLNTPGREISVAHEGTTALEWLVERPYSLVLTDLRLPGISGLDLIREIRDRDLPVTVIVMTAYATVGRQKCQEPKTTFLHQCARNGFLTRMALVFEHRRLADPHPATDHEHQGRELPWPEAVGNPEIGTIRDQERETRNATTRNIARLLMRSRTPKPMSASRSTTPAGRWDGSKLRPFRRLAIARSSTC